MKNIVLFGGAFDPIHLGHLNMAEQASKSLDAEVIFIPAKISVWKSESAPGEDKAKMIELSIKDIGREDIFSVSTYELDLNANKNYTINTVKHFKELYPNDNLYLLIGQDQGNSFHMWKDPEEIAKIAKIVYFGRLNEENDSENIKKYGMVEIKGENNDFSSTKIRELVSLDTTDSVLNYIIDNDLYFMRKIRSLLSEHRYNHSKSVAKLSYEIAKANKLPNPKKALIAGLIHDCSKELPREEEHKIMVENYPEYLHYPHIILHQFTSEYVAKKIFNIFDEEILTSIKYHTTGNSNIGKLGLIVYCADKIEPTRGFDSRDLINAMMNDLDSGFKTVMKANIEYYESKKIKYHNELTDKFLEQYYKE